MAKHTDKQKVWLYYSNFIATSKGDNVLVDCTGFEFENMVDCTGFEPVTTVSS